MVLILQSTFGVKDWIFANLSQSHKFVRDFVEWDLLFGCLLWFLWLRRNRRIFELQEVRWEPILDQGRRRQQECIAVSRSVVREIVQSGSVPRGVDLPCLGSADRACFARKEQACVWDGQECAANDLLSHRFFDLPMSVLTLFKSDLIE
ncbi:hypothetical protein V6N12_070083 [Hibiscus sabdariffa]|uniref:Uncharacterized protein n=1 Tax=Hibiscus sabdariffa TaxID=183260 RepID=A0ABR2FFQ5_9ROSI